MEQSANEIDEVVARLADTPRRVALITQGLEEAELHRQPDANSWSPSDILAHLRANADVWGKSILRMIAEDHPTIRYVSPRGWMTRSGYTAQEFSASLAAFSGQREELLEALRRLSSADWSRGATFTGTTLGREQTVLSYAGRIAGHEAQHIPQLEDAVKAVRT
jgi:hypothetical protein